MLELEKQNLHRNRLKGQTGTQVTLDDDFIVPDTMSDVGEIILDCGSLQLEPVKVQRERVTVRGKLEFHVLYRKEEGGLQTLGGRIPFEETINVPELEEKDYVSVSPQLDDLIPDLIKIIINLIIIIHDCTCKLQIFLNICCYTVANHFAYACCHRCQLVKILIHLLPLG